jgi:hypothetical protein
MLDLRFSQRWLRRALLMGYNTMQSSESQYAFRRNISPPHSAEPCLLPASCSFPIDLLFAPNVEVIRSPETSVNIHRTIWHYIPEDRTLHIHCFPLKVLSSSVDCRKKFYCCTNACIAGLLVIQFRSLLWALSTTQSHHHSHTLVVCKHPAVGRAPGTTRDWLQSTCLGNQRLPCFICRIDRNTIIDELIRAAERCRLENSHGIFMSINSASPKTGVPVGSVLWMSVLKESFGVLPTITY